MCSSECTLIGHIYFFESKNASLRPFVQGFILVSLSKAFFRG